MRINDFHRYTLKNNDIFGLQHYSFTEVEEEYNHLGIAREIGIFSNEVKQLQKEINRA